MDKYQLPGWATSDHTSVMETILCSKLDPNMISFALGKPELKFFPKEAFQQAALEVINSDVLAFQYAPPQEELKSYIVQLMRDRGIDCTENQILLTSGAQQGIHLLTRLLLDKNRSVIMEELAYPGMLQVLTPYSPHILTVPTDSHTGIDVEAVLDLLKTGIQPAFLYLVTDGGNPIAVSVSIEKRCQLAQLAEHYGIPIIEDDPYGFLNYNRLSDSLTRYPSPLRSYSPDWVFYVGSFSKILSPSLRAGWIVAPEILIAKLASLKESMDINMTTLSQRILTVLLRKNVLNLHISQLCHYYARRRDQLTLQLQHYFTEEIDFRVPESGIFLWVNFLNGINTSYLLKEAIKQKVMFMPSEYFFATKDVHIYTGARFNFSYVDDYQIQEGIQRLFNAFETIRR